MITGNYKLSFEDYLSDPCPHPSLSRSTIIDLLDSPARAWWKHPRLNPPSEDADEETGDKKFDPGKAAHSLFLEGVDKVVVVDPLDHPGAKGAIPKGWTTNEMREVRDIIRDAGKIPLLPRQYKNVCEMVAVAANAIRECTELGITNLRTEGDSELSYIWQEKNGIWCRCRPDWISKDRKLICDFKTTGKSANPMFLDKHISSMGYEVQESFYRRGVKAVEGTEPTFIFIFQEVEPPYLCSFVSLSSQFQDMGEQKVKKAIKIWEECLSTGVWPGYPKNIYCADAPAWALTTWEMNKYGGQ